MGIFGRSRANTTSEISQPVLTFSDAAPREDLQNLSAAVSPRPHTSRAGRSITPSGGRRRLQQPQNVDQAFDFTVTEPPEGLAASESPSFNGSRMDLNGIGIALGSPSMVPPPQYPPMARLEKEEVTSPSSLRRKPSKWRKFGELLKARQPEVKQTREGFYQLDTKECQAGNGSGSQHHPSRINVPFDQRESVKRSPQISGRQDDTLQRSAGGGALLKVDIPAVQMERYSVMFRSVLGEKPSSSLLARRSKALDQLHVHGNEPKLPESYKPQRRGTSPVPSKSPSMSQEQTTNSTNKFAPKSPARSNTYPRVSVFPKITQSHLVVPDLTPALSTGSSLDYSSTGSSSTPVDSPVVIKSHVDGVQTEPAWEMVTKQQSMSPETTYNIIPGDASIRSTPATTPLVGTTSPLIKALPPAPLLVPQKSSLPRLQNAAKKNTTPGSITSKYNAQADKEGDQLLPPRQPAHEPTPKLLRSQTMPLPLNINKSKSQAESQPRRQKSAATKTSSATPSGHETTMPQTIEISIARSVSVARRVPKQTLVPLGATPQAFHNDNERFGEHQKLLPTLVNVSGGGNGGHRHQKSQDIVIETL